MVVVGGVVIIVADKPSVLLWGYHLKDFEKMSVPSPVAQEYLITTTSQKTL